MMLSQIVSSEARERRKLLTLKYLLTRIVIHVFTKVILCPNLNFLGH